MKLLECIIRAVINFFAYLILSLIAIYSLIFIANFFADQTYTLTHGEYFLVWIVMSIFIRQVSGDISENDIIKYKDNEVGKIMIDKPYSFALVKVVEPDLKEFSNTELMCGKSKVKILKPEWI